MRLRVFLPLVAVVVGCASPPAPTPPTVVVEAPAETAKPLAAAACDDGRYEPAGSGTAPPAKLPALPAIPDAPLRRGDAFTVRGAIHAFRNPGELAALAAHPEEVVVEGVVVDENVSRAPRCAFHASGKRDPKGCAPEIPTFWLADDTTPNAPRLRVLGWASSFSQVFEARRLANTNAKPGGIKPPNLWRDERWGTNVPWPLPEKGQRLRIRGSYGRTFERAVGALVEDANNGVFSVEKIDHL